MFRRLVWPSSVRYKQEYNFKYKNVGTIPALKTFISNYMDNIKIIENIGQRTYNTVQLFGWETVRYIPP
jgi:hypothetical protein